MAKFTVYGLPGVYNSTPLTLNDEDGTALAVDINGRLILSDTVSLSVDSELPAAALLADNTTNPTITSVGAYPHWFDGTTWDRAQGSSTDGLLVNLGVNNDVVVSASDHDISIYGDVGILDQLDLTNSNPAVVAIVDADGTQITSFGGGTQYAVDAALGATPTGTLAIAIRDDALSTLTPVEGDAIGIRVDSQGALWSKADHVITGIGHGVKTVTTAGTDEALATSTACKKVIIQAQTDNTGLIAIGASGVDATVATGTGLGLTVGDVVVLQIDNLADIYIDATVNGEGVRYTYFT